MLWVSSLCFWHMLIKKWKKLSFLLFFLLFFKSCKFQPFQIDNHLILGTIIIVRCSFITNLTQVQDDAFTGKIVTIFVNSPLLAWSGENWEYCDIGELHPRYEYYVASFFYINVSCDIMRWLYYEKRCASRMSCFFRIFNQIKKLAT